MPGAPSPSSEHSSFSNNQYLHLERIWLRRRQPTLDLFLLGPDAEPTRLTCTPQVQQPHVPVVGGGRDRLTLQKP